MVEAPTAAEAARRLDHTQKDNQRRENLTDGGMRRSHLGKAGQTQTDCKRAEGEQNAAGKRPLVQPEQDQAWRLHPSINRETEMIRRNWSERLAAAGTQAVKVGCVDGVAVLVDGQHREPFA